MNKMVLLDYTFLFDPDTAWSHLSMFEKDLSDFFAAYGMTAEVVDTMKGQLGKRILLIKRTDKMFRDQQFQQQAQRQKGASQTLDKMQEKLQLAGRPEVKK